MVLRNHFTFKFREPRYENYSKWSSGLVKDESTDDDDDDADE